MNEALSVGSAPQRPRRVACKMQKCAICNRLIEYEETKSGGLHGVRTMTIALPSPSPTFAAMSTPGWRRWVGGRMFFFQQPNTSSFPIEPQPGVGGGGHWVSQEETIVFFCACFTILPVLTGKRGCKNQKESEKKDKKRKPMPVASKDKN